MFFSEFGLSPGHLVFLKFSILILSREMEMNFNYNLSRCKSRLSFAVLGGCRILPFFFFENVENGIRQIPNESF